MMIEEKLPPLVAICIPPTIADAAKAVAAQDIHPAWQKLRQRGRHFVLTTTDLEDITEVADWARTALVEPERPLTKGQRQAFAAVINRASRWAVIEPLGHCHCMAVQWREGKARASAVVKTDGTISSAHSSKA
jgi:hypothetical protein